MRDYPKPRIGKLIQVFWLRLAFNQIAAIGFYLPVGIPLMALAESTCGDCLKSLKISLKLIVAATCRVQESERRKTGERLKMATEALESSACCRNRPARSAFRALEQ